MSNSNLKNIIVLNDLPSNLIEEAIIVLKSKKSVKSFELAEKNSSNNNYKSKEIDGYIIKEAENVISNYISKIETKQNVKKSDINIETKYKRIKTYSIIISFLLFFCIVKTFF